MAVIILQKLRVHLPNENVRLSDVRDGIHHTARIVDGFSRA